MQESNYILKELNELGVEVLVTAGNKNCFSVPDNYFENLPGNIAAHIFLQSLPVSNIYSVPAGYFENLADVIIDKIRIRNTVSNADKNIYSVPEGYFNSLADNILKKIKSSDNNAVQQELEEIAPLLSKIPKTNVYTVPENYFSHTKPLAAIANKRPAKVISFGSRTRKWINYAVAACVAAVLFSGGYLYFNKPANITTPPIANIDVQKEISGLTDAQITEYLDDNSNMAVYTNGDDAQPNMDLQNLLQNVSDEEIQQFLNQDIESAGSEEGI